MIHRRSTPRLPRHDETLGETAQSNSRLSYFTCKQSGCVITLDLQSHYYSKADRTLVLKIKPRKDKKRLEGIIQGKHNVASPFKIATSKKLKSDFTTGHIISRFRTPSSTRPLPPSTIHPRWNCPPLRDHPRATPLSWCSIEKIRVSVDHVTTR